LINSNGETNEDRHAPQTADLPAASKTPLAVSKSIDKPESTEKDAKPGDSA